MIKTENIGFLVILLAFALIAYAAAGEINIKDIKTPLPEEGIKIIPPDSNIPANIANYSGIWEGTYNNGRDVTLIIEKIVLPPGIVSAIYSFGNLQIKRKISWGEWYRVEGTVEKDTIVFKLSSKTITISPGKSNDTAILNWKTHDVMVMGGYTIVEATLKKKNK